MQERSLATRMMITAAAQRQFAARGYEKTSVAGICAEAGVSKGAFYHHFQSKQELFNLLLQDWLSGIRREMNDLLAETSDMQSGLARLAEQYRQVLLSSSQHLPLLLEFWRAGMQDAAVKQAATQPYRDYQRLFAAVIARGVRSGVFGEVDADVTARMFMALGMGILLQGMLAEDDGSLGDSADQLVNLMMNSLYRREK